MYLQNKQDQCCLQLGDGPAGSIRVSHYSLTKQQEAQSALLLSCCSSSQEVRGQAFCKLLQLKPREIPEYQHLKDFTFPKRTLGRSKLMLYSVEKALCMHSHVSKASITKPRLLNFMSGRLIIMLYQ